MTSTAYSLHLRYVFHCWCEFDIGSGVLPEPKCDRKRVDAELAPQPGGLAVDCDLNATAGDEK